MLSEGKFGPDNEEGSDSEVESDDEGSLNSEEEPDIEGESDEEMDCASNLLRQEPLDDRQLEWCENRVEQYRKSHIVDLCCLEFLMG